MPPITLPEDLSRYERPDLIAWVADTCVVIPDHVLPAWDRIMTWCIHRLGEPRPHNIMREARDGWIDYFDGDWQVMVNPFCYQEEWVIWFAKRDDVAAFLVAWS
jgi:hypothetical protein